jgi:hypothetical protein
MKNGTTNRSTLLPFRFAMAIAIEGYWPIAISVLKHHLSALAVDSHGMTVAAVGGRAFLTYFICLFIIYKHLI